MAWTLPTLPGDTLALILGQKDLSAAILSLWLTGNRVLQHKLAYGVQSIHLKDTATRTRSQLPKFLENLPALRELTINRDYATLLGSHSAWKTVQCLPSCLVTLRLLFQDSNLSVNFARAKDSSSEAYDQPPSIGDLPPSSWTLKSAFPQLTTLEIGGNFDESIVDAFDALPDSLTSLALHGSAVNYYVVHMPRQLLRLKLVMPLQMPPIDFFLELPPNLVSLQFYTPPIRFQGNTPPKRDWLAEVWRNLPKTIQQFHAVYEFLPNDLATLLPHSLTTLNLDAKAVLTDINLSKIAPNLVNFFCGDYPTSMVNSLPRSLKTMTANLSGDSLNLSDWPPSLTKLTLMHHEKTFSPRILPPTLLHLHLPKYSWRTEASAIALMPRGLISLSLRLAPLTTNDIDFPPNLTELYITGETVCLLVEKILRVEGEEDYDESDEDESSQGHTLVKLEDYKCLVPGIKVLKCFPIEAIPRSVTNLTLQALIPASTLKHLPPHLTDLQVEDIFEDDDFDPCSQIEINRMRANFAIGQSECVLESIDYTQLTHASVAALLPRTLKKLSTRQDLLGLTMKDWSHFPTGIVKLHIGAMNADGLLHLPMNRLQRIHTRLHSPRDEHLKALPRDLKYGMITVSEAQCLTQASVHNVPVVMSSLVGAPAEVSMAITERFRERSP